MGEKTLLKLESFVHNLLSFLKSIYWHCFLEAVPIYLPLCVSQMKWHEICLSTPAAILEVLNAWENGVLSVEAVQVIPVLCVMVYFALETMSTVNR